MYSYIYTENMKAITTGRYPYDCSQRTSIAVAIIKVAMNALMSFVYAAFIHTSARSSALQISDYRKVQ